MGESGSGKSVTMMSVMRLINDPNAVFEGQVLYKGADLMTATESRMQDIRGAEMAMIFQDPMTSLNPVYKVGWQIAEQLQAHESMSDKQARAPHGRAVAGGGDSRSRGAGGRVSAPVFGRHAPAGDDRDGAFVQP